MAAVRSMRTVVAQPVRAVLRRLARGRVGRAIWERLKRWIDGDFAAGLDRRLMFMFERTPPDEWKELSRAWDDTTPLPPGAESALRDANPRLLELRSRYAAFAQDVGVPWQWAASRLGTDLDLRYFRGESPYLWQYRELPRVNKLKFYVAAQYIRAHDTHGLLERLGEDGGFGCWSYVYPGIGRMSRDLLDTVNELLFLDRQLGILARENFRVLDIGAGYGRLAYRMAQAVPGLADYCCTDAIAESTFLSEYYLRHRGVLPPARIVPLDEIDRALADSRFDLVVNVHSFSECTSAAIAWWLEKVARLRAPYLFIVPNDADRFLSTEADGSRKDFLPLIESAGYQLAHCEPVFSDPAVRELMNVVDHFCLFRLKTAADAAAHA